MTSPIRGPEWKDELVASFETLARTDAQFWGGLDPEVFVAPIGTAWSPADNVRHLSKSTKPVARALRLPKIVPALLFGRASARSRSYAEVVQAYRAVLAGGGTAGRFAPSGPPEFTDAAVYQRESVARWSAEVTRLAGAIEGWSESALDTYRLPHPLLGKLTVREMLMFTLYHNQHHLYVVARRRGEHASDDTPLN